MDFVDYLEKRGWGIFPTKEVWKNCFETGIWRNCFSDGNTNIFVFFIFNVDHDCLVKVCENKNVLWERLPFEFLFQKIVTLVSEKSKSKGISRKRF